MTNGFDQNDDHPVVDTAIEDYEEPQAHEHDQLPSVEEVRANAGLTRSASSSGSKRRKIAIIFLAVCFVGLIIGLSVSVAKRNNNDEDRLEPTLDFLTGVSSVEDVEDTSSPQYQAAVWIADLDPRRIPVPRNMEEANEEFLERYVLATLYFATVGDKWINNLRFLSSRHVCGWNRGFRSKDSTLEIRMGAICGENSQEKVTEIWIRKNNMAGELPWKELTYLTSLIKIDLERNYKLTGSLPENIDAFSDLEILAFSNDDIGGSLPDSMANLKSLRKLFLDDNEFYGDILPIIGLQSLMFVLLEDNDFSGTVTDSYFANATDLIQLDLSGNYFEGTIPPHLFQMDYLEVLDLSDNDFAGPLPSDIEDQDVLQFLAVHENELSGEIPGAIGDLIALTHLDLSDNLFVGAIPVDLGDLALLTYLFVGENDFDAGTIPTFLQNLPRLRELSLKSSNRTGGIPEWIGTLSDLRLLDLDWNELEGQIPTSMGNLTNLEYLLLNRNKLEGEVPASFAELPLKRLLLDNNSFTGDLEFLCGNFSKAIAIESLIADCGGEEPEVNCATPSCCTECCDDDGPICNDYRWSGSYNPTWESGYERGDVYSFDISPAPDDNEE